MKKLPQLLAVAALLSFTTACAPSPDKVCDHVIELTKKDLGEEAAKAIDKDDCVKTAERKKEMKGMIKYKEEASCIMDAGSLEDLGKCGGSGD